MRIKPAGLLSFVLFLICIVPSPAGAQELAKIRSEYIDNPIRVYQPADPWHRSILYKLQTGHYGRFYNCDGEEEKRNSPYICWNKSDCPTIPKKNCIDCVNEQICKIKRRINDGACRSNPCSSCKSSTCNCGHAGYATKSQSQDVQVARRQGNIFEPDVASSSKPKTCNCETCRAKLNSAATTSRAKVNEQVTVGQTTNSKAANLLSRIRQSQSTRTATVTQQPSLQAAVRSNDNVLTKRR